MGCGYGKLVISAKKERFKNENGGGKQTILLDADVEEVKTLPRNGLQLQDDQISGVKRRLANKIKPIPGPMRPPINRSASQVDFFRMLDEKIANGRDYDTESEDDEDDDEPRTKLALLTVQHNYSSLTS